MNEYNDIKIDELRKTIQKFNNDENVIQLERYYQSKSLPEILGASRKKLSHSSFLAWLLNSDEGHLLRQYSLKKFLELIVL